MANKTALKELLKKIDRLEGSLPIGDAKEYLNTFLNGEVKKFKETLSQNPNVQAFELISDKLEKFKKDFNLTPIINEIESIQKEISEFKQSTDDINYENESKIEELNNLIEKAKKELGAYSSSEFKKVLEKIGKLEQELSYQSDNSESKRESLGNALKGFEAKLADVSKTLEDNKKIQSGLMLSLDGRFDEKDQNINKAISAIEELRIDLMSRISNLGGGQANRQINVKSSVMSSKYNDINFANGGGIVWSTSDDNTTKQVNLTASIIATGGGGTPGGADTQVQFNNNGAFGGDIALTWASSILTVGQQGSVKGVVRLAGATTGTVGIQVSSTAGNWNITLPPSAGSAGQYLQNLANGVTQWASVASGTNGITRAVSIITANTTGGTTAQTDYVYHTEAGLTFTLPTAINNTNLYTVKNFANSSVLVAVSNGQAIDGSDTALVTTQYQALSFISNGSVWGVI